MTPEQTSIIVIYVSVGLALLWAIIQAIMVTRIKLVDSNTLSYQNFDEDVNLIGADKLATIQNIGNKISTGATAFLV